MRKKRSHIPDDFKVLPFSIPFIVRGFESQCPPEAQTFAPKNIDCTQWYRQFVDRVIQAHGCRFLPVCRMSDGEFLFALGPQPANRGTRWRERSGSLLEMARSRLKMRHFKAQTIGHYNSGEYTPEEWNMGRAIFADGARYIANHGILAVHLSYGSEPFQERYFPALKRWFRQENIQLIMENYVPFYFVYALLTGPDRHRILRSRILVLNGSEGTKKKQIISGLYREGASEVLWHDLSPTRSMFDLVKVDEYAGKIDVALVGAGIGKLNVIPQLSPLQVPCLDAGYVFEVWADAANGSKRPLCKPDDIS